MTSESEQILERVLQTLTDQENRVLRLRFGLDSKEPQALKTIAGKLRVTRERIRQVEAKALRKLRHPFRVKLLEDVFEEFKEPDDVEPLGPRFRRVSIAAPEGSIWIKHVPKEPKDAIWSKRVSTHHRTGNIYETVPHPKNYLGFRARKWCNTWAYKLPTKLYILRDLKSCDRIRCNLLTTVQDNKDGTFNKGRWHIKCVRDSLNKDFRWIVIEKLS